MIHNISARGVLERDNKILFIEYENAGNILYSLPGGSQSAGEDLRQTVKREFMEETGLEIESHDVIMVREFILERSDFENWKSGVHQVEIIFRCTLTNKDQEASAPSVPDIGMKRYLWINKESIKDMKIYPSKDLCEIMERRNITYLFSRD